MKYIRWILNYLQTIDDFQYSIHLIIKWKTKMSRRLVSLWVNKIICQFSDNNLTSNIRMIACHKLLTSDLILSKYTFPEIPVNNILIDINFDQNFIIQIDRKYIWYNFDESFDGIYEQR